MRGGAAPGKIRTTYTNQFVAPYFNSAFVAVPAGRAFGRVWLDCCRAIDAAAGVPNKRPYLDQIALSPAVSKLGLAFDCLDERYNHPINFKPLDPQDLPYFCHYHDTGTLAREPAAVAAARALLAEYPGLAPVLAADPAWAGVAAAPAPRRSFGGCGGAGPGARVPEVVITGIPRSGTSYLCNLLHRFDNCVVLNEPDEIGPALERPTPPWPVATFYRDVRRDVLAGRAVRNKLVGGKVTEDTTRANQQVPYTPKVTGEDFVLGVKATIPFLSRLPHLRRVMPHARFVACVRNPFDTIASWKTTFADLREGDVGGTRIGNPRDPWLSDARGRTWSRWPPCKTPRPAGPRGGGTWPSWCWSLRGTWCWCGMRNWSPTRGGRWTASWTATPPAGRRKRSRRRNRGKKLTRWTPPTFRRSARSRHAAIKLGVYRVGA